MCRNGVTGMTDREVALLWLSSFVKNKELMTLIPKQLIRLMYDALREQPEWIPCSERNGPEKQEIVLVSMPGHVDDNGEEYVPSVRCAYTITTPVSGTMWFGSDGVTFGLEGRLPVEPVAWMPLPKLYHTEE